MGWIKKGLIFQAEGGPAWMSTHAALPVADPIADDLFAVYFSSRDWNGRAQIGRFDFRLNDIELRDRACGPQVPILFGLEPRGYCAVLFLHRACNQ